MSTGEDGAWIAHDSASGGDFLLIRVLEDVRGLLTRSAREETGQGLSEYALILFFIAIVAIAALTFLGSDISSILSQVATNL
jgi:Flp pilus assembly pilin Flp